MEIKYYIYYARCSKSNMNLTMLQHRLNILYQSYKYWSISIILKRMIKLVALLLLSYICIVTINVLWFFLTVPLVGLQYVIVVFADHTHLHF